MSRRDAGGAGSGRGRVRSRWLVIVPSVLAAAGLVAGVAYVIADGGSGPAPRPRPAALSSPNPDTTKPVPQYHVPAQLVPVALPSTGAVPLPTSAQPQVTAWKAGRGGSALKTVSAAAGSVAQESGLKEYAPMKAACSQLGAGVQAALAAPPIPVAAMQELYQKALSGLGRAASECQSAISEQPDGDEYIATSEDKSVLNQAQSALATAARELFTATGAS